MGWKVFQQYSPDNTIALLLIYPGSHVSQAPSFTIPDYKRKCITILKIRAQVFLKVKYWAQLSLGTQLRGLSLYFFLLSYTQLLEVWSIEYLVTSAPVCAIPTKLVGTKLACEHSVH